MKHMMIGKNVNVAVDAETPEKAVVRFLRGEKLKTKRIIKIMDSKMIYTFDVTKKKTTNAEKEKHGTMYLYKLIIQLVTKRKI